MPSPRNVKDYMMLCQNLKYIHISVKHKVDIDKSMEGVNIHLEIGHYFVIQKHKLIV